MDPFQAVLATLGVIFLVAFLNESLIEYFFGLPFEHIEKLQPFKWLLPYIAAISGVSMAFVYSFDLIALLGQFLGIEVIKNPVGVAITGLAIGRGADYLHQIVQKYFVRN